MTVLVVGSLHGSPGATTVAVALAACHPDGIVVEADCDGGVLAARLGLAREPGVVTLAADRDAGAGGGLAHHAQHAPVGVPVVVGPESSDHATWLWRSTGQQLAEAATGHSGAVVVDAGRLSPSSPLSALVSHASLTVIVARPRADELAVVAAKLTAHEGPRRPSVVLVGDRPYSDAEVAAELGCDVLGVIAHDERAVATLWDGGSRRSLARSAFARSIQSLAETVADRLEHRGEHENGIGPLVATP